MKIVLVGDSYSAGNGARDSSGDRDYYGPGGCYRSHSNWAEKYAHSLRDAGYNITLINRACSGAVTTDLLNDRKMSSDTGQIIVNGTYSDINDAAALAELENGNPCVTKYPDEEYYKYRVDAVQPVQYGGPHTLLTYRCDRYLIAQLDAVGADTDLVLFTIGGNDVNFSDIVKQCFAVGFRDPGDCRNRVSNAQTNMHDVGTQIQRMIEQMRTNGMRDDARVVLLSYPYLSLDDDFTLVSHNLLGAETDRYDAADGVRALGDLGDSVQRQAVADSNIGHPGQVMFLDAVKSDFTGHEPAGSASYRNPDRWLHEFDTRIMSEWYHPNELGHPELARLLAQGGSYNAGNGATSSNGDIDIIFAIDTTGSMGSSINQVKQYADQIVDNVTSRTSSARFGLVTYRDQPSYTGDPSDYASRLDQPFLTGSTAIKAAVNAISVGGGGDYPESMYSGLMTSLEQPWRPGVKKVVLVLADAPPHDPEPVTGYTAQTVIDKAFAVDPAEVYVVDTGGAADAAVQRIVTETGGDVVDAAISTDVPGAITAALNTALDKPYAWAGGPYVTTVGKTIELDASGSYASSGSIASYEWDLDGDGTFDRSTASATTAMSWPSQFDGTITVRATDDQGRSALATAHVAATPDGDEVAQESDNCPSDNNPGQEDYDGDESGDVCDNTPGLPTTDLEGVTEQIGGDQTAPTISTSSPTAGATYGVGQRVLAVFGCTDEAGGSGVDTCAGTTPNGAPLTTTTPGNYSFTVTARDTAGNQASVAVPYAVALGAPVISQLSPSGQVVATAGGSVTITGYNFTSGATVKFGKKSGSNVTVLGPDRISVIAPSSTTVGEIAVTVSTTMGTSNSLNYSYWAADPDPQPCDRRPHTTSCP
jgi:hypothetical protein